MKTTAEKEIDQVREYVPRHITKRNIEMSSANRQLSGQLNSNYILAKLSQNIDEFKKVTNKEYQESEQLETLGDEFEVRWYHLLNRHGMDYLPPNIPMYVGSKSILHQELLSLIEEMMSRAGARRDVAQEQEVEISWEE